MFQKFPCIKVECESTVAVGWTETARRLQSAVRAITKSRKVIVLEFYQGVLEKDVLGEMVNGLQPDILITAESLYWPPQRIREMVSRDVTDDRVFGYMSRLQIEDYFDPEKLANARNAIASHGEGIVLIAGIGAAIVPEYYDLLVYADMARWEIQMRMRNHEVSNIGVRNENVSDWMLLYKQGYFVDWRVCDRLKKSLMRHWDFVLDTNSRNEPKLVEGKAILDGLRQTLTRPFSVVPFFDPGPWGGQWMKQVCGLDPSAANFAWCFNCVPEENSLLLEIGGKIVEIPSINLVFFEPERLLGSAVHGRFGDEFPIRFDFLDTMGGGNLSLQVHPLTEYIQEKFGMHYTQDESYYIMEAKEGAVVYLGLKDGVDRTCMIDELEKAQAGGAPFDVERYVQTWSVRKHDHYLIPGGTVHCSGKNSVVLEISATPYIFTFKLWDWGRLGLDGRPRPINIEHGKRVIQWTRTTSWSRENLVNQFEFVGSGDGWAEERTGLHEREFIETRRHWFTKPVLHDTDGGVNVLTLVEGDEIIVKSPSDAFSPFVVNYAETFIVPACVGEYNIHPTERNGGRACATIKAFVRTETC